MKKTLSIFFLLFLAVGVCFGYERIENPDPITEPATPAKTYNKYWMQFLAIKAPSPTKSVDAEITLTPWDGGANITGDYKTRKTVYIKDIFGKAQTDQELAEAINQLIKIAAKYAK